MNGNFKYKLTDEQRSKLRDKLAGKKSKSLATRNEVSQLLQKCLDDFLSGRAVDQVEPEPDAPDFHEVDYDSLSAQDVSDVMKANELLRHRINVLQHRIDTERSK